MHPKPLIAGIAFASCMLIAGTDASAFASFCDDNACSVDCGEPVSLDNPRCLGESGRNCILFASQDNEF
jgi:hypothetical protein